MSSSRSSSIRIKLAVYFLTVIAASVSIPASSSAQDIDRHDEHTVTSSTSPSARFEIVQSTLNALQTFKLDKQTGGVQILVKNWTKAALGKILRSRGLKQFPRAPTDSRFFCLD